MPFQRHTFVVVLFAGEKKGVRSCYFKHSLTVLELECGHKAMRIGTCVDGAEFEAQQVYLLSNFIIYLCS